MENNKEFKIVNENTKQVEQQNREEVEREVLLSDIGNRSMLVFFFDLDNRN
jgi:hypothetical protein